MNFDLTEEQQLLADTARDVLSRSYDTESRNKVVQSELGWSRDVWRQLAEIGILGLGFEPEESGQIEIMVVMTEIGRRLAPNRWPRRRSSGRCDRRTGQRRAARVARRGGRRRETAGARPSRAGLRGSDALATRATQQGDSWTVTGRKNPVLAGDSADVLVVTATLPGGGAGLFLVDADATSRQPYRTFDGQRGAEIVFDGAAAEPLGGGDAVDRIHATLIRYSSALCAEAVGAMDEALGLTTEYLKARKQFGVPLKTFQTLTQRAADMYVSLELARSMNYYAAMCIADGRLDPVVAARAKLQIGLSGRHIAQEAIQMHGGIGVTAEYPVAHYAARLTGIEQTLGSSTDQLRFLSGQVGAYDIVAL